MANIVFTSDLLRRLARLSKKGINCFASSVQFGCLESQLEERGITINRALFWTHADCNAQKTSEHSLSLSQQLIKLADFYDYRSKANDTSQEFDEVVSMARSMGVFIHPYRFWVS